MKALKCKTLGASVMYIHVHVGVKIYVHGNLTCIRGQMRECMVKYMEIWQRQKL